MILGCGYCFIVMFDEVLFGVVVVLFGMLVVEGCIVFVERLCINFLVVLLFLIGWDDDVFVFGVLIDCYWSSYWLVIIIGVGGIGKMWLV